jgi:site-specific recombinase XerD
MKMKRTKGTKKTTALTVTGKLIVKKPGKEVIDKLYRKRFGGVHPEIKRGIYEGVEIVREELEVNPELRKKVVERVVEKKIIEEVEKDFNKSGIDTMMELKDFLKIQTSKITMINYRRSTSDFLKWCFFEKIDAVKITRREVESYMVSLTNKYAPNSVRTHILSICSFYNFLVHRYPSVITVNPFSKLKLPKMIPTRRIDMITENDLKELKTELKRIGRKDIICAVDLLCTYGFRVGIFKNMKIDKEGNWNSVSKETSMKGKFLKSEVKMINETGILELKGYTITNIIVKYTKKLFKEGKIGSPFSPHDIRHWYITTKGKGLTMEDFIKFSRGIHKNVNTTLQYMNI